MAHTEKAELLFESLVRDMLARNPTIKHEWRPVNSPWSRDRLDLVCDPGTENEVWATIRDGQIAVGNRQTHDDFEQFGRQLAESAIAEEAFENLVARLRAHGHPAVAV